MMNSTEYKDIIYDAWVSNTIPVLTKLLRNESINFSSYYFGGSLVIDMPDIRSDKSYVSFNVLDIKEFMPGDEMHQQYLISRMYIKNKNHNCAFYDLAKANIKIFENV